MNEASVTESYYVTVLRTLLGSIMTKEYPHSFNDFM